MFKRFLAILAICTAVLFSPSIANAQSGHVYNGANHAVIVHDSAGFHWLYTGQYRQDIDRWRPDANWQMAWHFAGEYTEHYTTCHAADLPQWSSRCYSYNSFRDVVIDNGWPI